MELDAAQVKPKKEVEKEKSSLTERLEVAMSSLVNVFPETDLDFLVSIIVWTLFAIFGELIYTCKVIFAGETYIFCQV